MPGKIYRPNPEQDGAWLWLDHWNSEINQPDKVSWKKEWGLGRIDMAPSDCSEQLGISLESLSENPRELHCPISCPFCSTNYFNRFEIRDHAKKHCGVCQGSGERAAMAEATVDFWLEEIREAKDIERAVLLRDRVGGIFDMNAVRLVRVLSDDAS